MFIAGRFLLLEIGPERQVVVPGTDQQFVELTPCQGMPLHGAGVCGIEYMYAGDIAVGALERFLLDLLLHFHGVDERALVLGDSKFDVGGWHTTYTVSISTGRHTRL